MSAANQAVFLSYAREDAERARRIAEALRAFGVEVWFDQNELRGGDQWDQKIRTQIKTCALFVPVISQQTEARAEGYFRREWKIAIDRTQDMGGTRAFIVPVVIDGTRETGADVPEEFRRYQWTRLADGEPTPDFVAQVKRLLDSPRKPPGAPAAPAVAAGPVAPHPAPARSPALLAMGAATVLALLAAGYFALRPAVTPATSPAAAATKSPAESKAAAPAPVSDKSIAVLPFSNLSEEKDSSFFADGVHEDILTNLALVKELRVVSRTSVMQYRGTTKTMRQIAQELGVAYILEGSVRRSGNMVRVTGQLIRAATDEHVWAKNYDKDLTNVFALQSELSQAIAGALSAALSPAEKQLLDRRPTDNLAAYDAYVKARQLRGTNVAASFAQAEPLLLQAVQLDPKFAAAWAELGSFHAFQFFNETDRSSERLAKAQSAIETAVRLAPDAPEVIEKLGDYHYYGYRDYRRALEQYSRLAVLRPNDAVVFGSLGLIHRRQGRFAEALANFRRASQLEPRQARYARNLFSTAQAVRLYDEAAAAQRRVVELADNSASELSLLHYIPFLARGSAHELQAWLASVPADKARDLEIIAIRKLLAVMRGDFKAYADLDRQARYFDGYGNPPGVDDTNTALVFAALGDRAAAQIRAAEAVADLETRLEKQPSNASFWANLGVAHALLGHRDDALRCAQKAKDLVPESRDALSGPAYSVAYACCLAWLGEKDRALAELERLLRTPWGENIHAAKSGTTWFPLRGDPRFEALVNDPKNNAPLL